MKLQTHGWAPGAQQTSQGLSRALSPLVLRELSYPNHPAPHPTLPACPRRWAPRCDGVTVGHASGLRLESPMPSQDSRVAIIHYPPDGAWRLQGTAREVPAQCSHERSTYHSGLCTRAHSLSPAPRHTTGRPPPPRCGPDERKMGNRSERPSARLVTGASRLRIHLLPAAHSPEGMGIGVVFPWLLITGDAGLRGLDCKSIMM
jgi:hypothetical protein